MKIILFMVLIVLGTAVQSMLPSIKLIGDIRLELLPGLVVCAAIQFGLRGTVCLSSFAGLCHDALSVGPFGLTAIAFAVASLLIATMRQVLDPDLPWFQMMAGALVVCLASFLSCLAIGITGELILAIIVLMWIGAFVAPLICFLYRIVIRTVSVA